MALQKSQIEYLRSTNKMPDYIYNQLYNKDAVSNYNRFKNYLLTTVLDDNSNRFLEILVEDSVNDIIQQLYD